MMDTDSDWVEYFISVIESKPVLYDKGLQEISDKESRRQTWNEVCESVIENWENLNEQEKMIKNNDIQQRWKNLRSCFTRELREQRKDASRPVAKKRRKYIYFEQLMFLLPHLDHDHSNSTPSSSTTHYEVEDSFDGQGTLDNVDLILNDEKPPSLKRPIIQRRKQNIMRLCDDDKRVPFWDEPSMSISRKEEDDIDEDKMFLLSILPAMRRLGDDRKYDLKIEVLKIMKRYANASSHKEIDFEENKES